MTPEEMELQLQKATKEYYELGYRYDEAAAAWHAIPKLHLIRRNRAYKRPARSTACSMIDTIPTSIEITEALERLGSTGVTVAKNLLSQGIRGGKVEAFRCPISNYLTKQFPKCGFGVCRDSISVHSEDEESITIVYPPPQISMFIRDFDHGYYPKLEI